MTSTCGICGGVVRSDVSTDWHAGKRARHAERDMLAHLKTHSFAEVLRYEIRQDLDQVPADQRPSIVRDIYRSLLGTTRDGAFTLGAADGVGAYSIDEVLGDVALYRLWRSANACGDDRCRHAVSWQLDPST
jgi:hypothetical protein